MNGKSGKSALLLILALAAVAVFRPDLAGMQRSDGEITGLLIATIVGLVVFFKILL